MDTILNVLFTILEFLPFLLFFIGPELAFGIYFLVTALKTKNRETNEFITPVEATCVEHKILTVRARAAVHQSVNPVYQFMYNGTQYTVENEVSSSSGGWINRFIQIAFGQVRNPNKKSFPDVGETKTIYINENDLTKYVDPDEGKRARIVLLIFSFIMFGVAILLFFGSNMHMRIASCIHPGVK